MNSYAYMFFLIHGHSSKVGLKLFQSCTTKGPREVFGLPTEPEENYSDIFSLSCYPSLRYHLCRLLD